MVDKEYGSTSKQIQADLQAEGLTMLVNLCHQEGILWYENQGDPNADTRTYLRKPIILGECTVNNELYGKAYHSTVYRKQNEALREKGMDSTALNMFFYAAGTGCLYCGHGILKTIDCQRILECNEQSWISVRVMALTASTKAYFKKQPEIV